MTAYNKSIDFAALAGADAIPSIFNTEFNLVATAVNSKANSASPTFTGTVVVPALASITSHAGITTNTSPVQSSEAYMHTFPTGTKTVFYQATAPLGWTQDTTAGIHDSVLRVVNSAGGGTTAGTHSISAGISVASHVLSVNEIPAHTHAIRYVINGSVAAGANGVTQVGGPSTPYTNGLTQSTGGGVGHVHSLNGYFAGTTTPSAATLWAPRYSNFIMCIKD